jgi:hypothetical protein
MLVTGAAVLVVTYVTLAAVAVPHLGRVVFPRAPVLALPAGCRVFNSYDLGGIVILLRPDERGVDCVLMRPSSPLGRDPDWREVTHHRYGSAYIRGRD